MPELIARAARREESIRAAKEALEKQMRSMPSHWFETIMGLLGLAVGLACLVMMTIELFR